MHHNYHILVAVNITSVNKNVYFCNSSFKKNGIIIFKIIYSLVRNNLFSYDIPILKKNLDYNSNFQKSLNLEIAFLLSWIVIKNIHPLKLPSFGVLIDYYVKFS